MAEWEPIVAINPRRAARNLHRQRKTLQVAALPTRPPPRQHQGRLKRAVAAKRKDIAIAGLLPTKKALPHVADAPPEVLFSTKQPAPALSEARPLEGAWYPLWQHALADMQFSQAFAKPAKNKWGHSIDAVTRERQRSCDDPPSPPPRLKGRLTRRPFQRRTVENFKDKRDDSGSADNKGTPRPPEPTVQQVLSQVPQQRRRRLRRMLADIEASLSRLADNNESTVRECDITFVGGGTGGKKPAPPSGGRKASANGNDGHAVANPSRGRRRSNTTQACGSSRASLQCSDCDLGDESHDASSWESDILESGGAIDAPPLEGEREGAAVFSAV
ncbi:unnamed protein product [Phaeothamnion confervicola]